MLQTRVSYCEEKFRKPITNRIKRMREEVVSSKPILCSERALLVTEAYKETENEPMIIRRAKAFEMEGVWASFNALHRFFRITKREL
jgi:formate C-acetyltransferase